MNSCPNCKHKSKTPVKQFDDLIFENWYTDPNNVLHTILVCAKCEHFCDLEGSLNPINWIMTKAPMKVNYISEVTFGSLKGEFMGVKFPDIVIKKFDEIKQKKHNISRYFSTFVEKSVKKLDLKKIMKLVKNSDFYSNDESGVFDGTIWISDACLYLYGAVMFAEDYANINQKSIENLLKIINKYLTPVKNIFEKELPPVNPDSPDSDLYEPLNILSKLENVHNGMYDKTYQKYGGDLRPEGKKAFGSFVNKDIKADKCFSNMNKIIINEVENIDAEFR